MNKQQYAEYKNAVADFDKQMERDCIRFPSVDLDTEPWFSWSPCECCGSTLGGDRYRMIAVDEDREIVEYAVCSDCMYYSTYGQLDDLTMLEIEESDD